MSLPERSSFSCQTMSQPYGLKEYREKVYAEKTECSKIKNMDIFYMSVHVLLHLLNEMRKIDNM